MAEDLTSFGRALELTLAAIEPLDSEQLPLRLLTGRVAAVDVHGAIDFPAPNASLKDGCALHAADTAAATRLEPVHLHLVGTGHGAGQAGGASRRQERVDAGGGGPAGHGQERDRRRTAIPALAAPQPPAVDRGGPGAGPATGRHGLHPSRRCPDLPQRTVEVTLENRDPLVAELALAMEGGR